MSLVPDVLADDEAKPVRIEVDVRSDCDRGYIDFRTHAHLGKVPDEQRVCALRVGVILEPRGRQLRPQDPFVEGDGAVIVR